MDNFPLRRKAACTKSKPETYFCAMVCSHNSLIFILTTSILLTAKKNKKKKTFFYFNYSRAHKNSILWNALYSFCQLQKFSHPIHVAAIVYICRESWLIFDKRSRRTRSLFVQFYDSLFEQGKAYLPRFSNWTETPPCVYPVYNFILPVGSTSHAIGFHAFPSMCGVRV